MSKTFSATAWRAKFLNIHTAIFLVALVSWPVLVELEVFDAFSTYSRAHQDWGLKSGAQLIANILVALVFSSIVRSRELKAVMKQRAYEYERAEWISRTDPLTGLMNRRAFEKTLETLAQDAEAPNRILAMIDLDRFKPINDLQGHAAGDAILRDVAGRIQSLVGTGSIAARLGGDEFAVVFGPGVRATETERIARQILDAIQRPFTFQNADLYIGCSIGLADWTSEVSLSDAMARADKALYSAKSQGRGQLAWYDEQLDREWRSRLQIEADLREAIRTSAIEPWFQPIFDIELKSVIGFEILARWNHPERGQIPPAVFIKIAEESGQISGLGRSLLTQACRATKDWGHHLSLSYNVSAVQLHDPALVGDVTSILHECEFDPKRLTIEINENSVIQDFAAARRTLDALRDLGISVALDDFGTGYAGLAGLRQLPFNRIKIDRGFVSNIGKQPRNQKIVEGIMSLAHGLELDVTAEGIETCQDLDFIRSLKCPLGQGFLFEKAMPADDITWLLETKWGELQHGCDSEPNAVEDKRGEAG